MSSICSFNISGENIYDPLAMYITDDNLQSVSVTIGRDYCLCPCVLLQLIPAAKGNVVMKVAL